jgi:hypothetical protein
MMESTAFQFRIVLLKCCADTTGNDMFENIDPELLSKLYPPTPMPTLTPRPAVVLTDTSLRGCQKSAQFQLHRFGDCTKNAELAAGLAYHFICRSGLSCSGVCIGS